MVQRLRLSLGPQQLSPPGQSPGAQRRTRLALGAASFLSLGDLNCFVGCLRASITGCDFQSLLDEVNSLELSIFTACCVLLQPMPIHVSGLEDFAELVEPRQITLVV